ncbi:hypothetical protein B0T16DRAFT_139118 [Cercophora newfieldiana]|uniref:Uncharacterized protein n=1 Tax=Cercophora newfieldiana TaxID=92897 RepID=A0AA39YCH2_9PEZI|nr:hypothetical protein B0T16DRAFT_139118 [Cercophora newfieldiana]
MGMGPLHLTSPHFTSLHLTSPSTYPAPSNKRACLGDEKLVLFSAKLFLCGHKNPSAPMDFFSALACLASPSGMVEFGTELRTPSPEDSAYQLISMGEAPRVDSGLMQRSLPSDVPCLAPRITSPPRESLLDHPTERAGVWSQRAKP